MRETRRHVSDEKEAQRKGRRSHGSPEVISTWEWVVGGIGLLLTIAAIGYLVRQAMVPQTPPSIVVRADSVSRTRGGFTVHFTARNEGRATAAEVDIEGRLDSGEGDAATSTVTLDYVPGNSTREGGLYFSEDPRQGTLELSARGYRTP
jgi:uncharacterized protein (TIGR02588 family)